MRRPAGTRWLLLAEAWNREFAALAARADYMHASRFLKPQASPSCHLDVVLSDTHLHFGSSPVLRVISPVCSDLLLLCSPLPGKTKHDSFTPLLHAPSLLPTLAVLASTCPRSLKTAVQHPLRPPVRLCCVRISSDAERSYFYR